MLNANKLRGRIVEHGMSIETVAAFIGIHRSTFYRKLSGECDMTIGEADAIVKLLGLTAHEADEIFFSQFVA